MAETTNISWCDATWNPWIGCTKVSPGCVNCYAENLMDTRYGRVQWGKGNPRSLTSEAYWKQPLKWNRSAIKNGTRLKVFCASLSDWLDDEVPVEWLARLLCLIVLTPKLDWLLLTKRPQNWRSRMEQVAALESDDFLISNAPAIAQAWLSGIAHHNVWFGATIENQEQATIRIPQLIAIPAKIRFLSCEPLLEAVTLDLTKIDWLIIGGESGDRARPFNAAWARSIIRQCRDDGVSVFVKQMGGNFSDGLHSVKLKDRKGGDMDEFNHEFQIREFPRAIA